MKEFRVLLLFFFLLILIRKKNADKNLTREPGEDNELFLCFLCVFIICSRVALAAPMAEWCRYVLSSLRFPDNSPLVLIFELNQ